MKNSFKMLADPVMHSNPILYAVRQTQLGSVADETQLNNREIKENE